MPNENIPPNEEDIDIFGQTLRESVPSRSEVTEGQVGENHPGRGLKDTGKNQEQQEG